MYPESVLIVGASQAGLQLACSLRDEGYPGRITLVGAEAQPPYQRPPLSKVMLDGSTPAGSLALRTPAFYRDRGIELVLGERVTSIRKASDGSGEAVTDSGRELRFGRLALATGARCRRLAIAGASSAGVHYLRDSVDAEHLARGLADATRVVVIGAGFIGLEVAASARKLGKQVDVVSVADRVMDRAVGAFTSNFFVDAHRRRGVRFQLGTGVEAFAAGDDGHVRAIRLSDGTILPADLVVVGVGVAPRAELAVQLGLATGNGIVVDEHTLTSDGVTVAVGDCTVLTDPSPGATERGAVRLESVGNAIEQAKVAARTLLGTPSPYRALPWFWSDQFDLKLQIAGLSSGHDEYVVRGDHDQEKFSVLYYRAGALIAADCVNSPLDFTSVKTALSTGQTIDAAAATDPAVRLKTLIRPLTEAVA